MSTITYGMPRRTTRVPASQDNVAMGNAQARQTQAKERFDQSNQMSNSEALSRYDKAVRAVGMARRGG